MEIVSSFLNGAKLISPSVFKDERGHFFESYNKRTFADLGINTDFVQDNQSYSVGGVLRGLHFQSGVNCQAKLISVLCGEIEDYIVDLRFGSPSFGQYQRTILNAENKFMLFIPHGFAHGFLVLSEGAKVLYKCDSYYNSASEGGIVFNDSELNIPWNLAGKEPILSVKDCSLGTFKDYKVNPVFKYE